MTITRTVPATCELWIDGTKYPAGLPSENLLDPLAISGLAIHWGRQNTIDQPSPATCTFEILDREGGFTRYDSTIHLGSKVLVWSELEGARVVVFGGRVTDLHSEWTDAGPGASLRVIAADMLADLANRFVGAEPWVMENLQARAQRILAAVGPAVTLVVAAAPAAKLISRMDVDRQDAAQLLFDLAVTGNAVLWAAVTNDTGGLYLYFEDPNARAALVVFVRSPPDNMWAPSASAATGTPLSACLVLRDPVEWTRAVTDLVTRATVRWRDQTTTPGTTERSVTLTDPSSEITYGARGLSIGTDLTTSADANDLAGQILAGHAPSDAWRIGGLDWDYRYTRATTASPPTPRVNASPRPSFEAGTDSGFDTGAITAASAVAGTKVLRFTATGATLVAGSTGTGRAAATPGHQYRVSLSVRQSKVSGGTTWDAAAGTWDAATGAWDEQVANFGAIRISNLGFYDSTGVYLGGLLGAEQTLTDGWLTLAAASGVAPASADRIGFGLSARGLTAGDTIDIDAILIEDTSTGPPPVPAVVVAVVGPNQVTGTSTVVSLPAEARAGDIVTIGYAAVGGAAEPTTFAEPGWTQVKARNSSGNCMWVLYARTLTVDGAQTITIVSAVSTTCTTVAIISRGHGTRQASAPTEGSTEPPATLPGLAPTGPGRLVTIAAGRVASTSSRPVITSGATAKGTAPPAGTNGALQWVVTDDRVTAAAPATPVGITWPPSGTRGGGGITLFLPDSTPPPGTYFDGSTPSVPGGWQYRWLGTVGLSPSIATASAFDPNTITLATNLLDNTKRIGLAINLQDLPWWTPTGARISLYVEGGSYRFEEGRWILSIDAVPATGLGKTMTFAETDPTCIFNDIRPTVTYLDMIGVSRAP